LIQTAKSKASVHVRARQPWIILAATPNHQRRAQTEQGANLEAIKEECLSKSCAGEVKESEDATRRIRDRTADSISSGRGAREHDERLSVLSRLHYGHHARFIRTVTLSNATMLRAMSSQTARGSASMGSRCCVIASKFTNTRLIRSLMSLVVAAKSTGCRGGRQCLFLTQNGHSGVTQSSTIWSGAPRD